MKICLVSHSEENIKLFNSRLKKLEIGFLCLDPEVFLNKTIENLQDGDIIYLDYSSFKAKEWNKIQEMMQEAGHFRFAVLDREGIVKDPAKLFFDGFADYLGPHIQKNDLDKERIKLIECFKKTISKPENSRLSNQFDYQKLSGKDWKAIKTGKEYTFCMLYVGFDRTQELMAKYSERVVNQIVEEFRNYLEDALTEINGEMWIWSDTKGLVLFPFDGEGIPQLRWIFDFMLNRAIINEDLYESKIDLAYHFVLHIGDTQYNKRGNTGRIVSDSINSLFHIGSHFSDDSAFFLTETCKDYIPEQFQIFFKKTDKYDGINLFKMRKPLIYENKEIPTTQ